MKMLLNYIVVDRAGYDYVARKCNQWMKNTINDVSDIIDDLITAGVLVGRVPRPGLFVVGNMYNPNRGIDGALWTTGSIVSVLRDEDGEMMVLTSSGSKYHLAHPLAISVANPNPSVRTEEVPIPTTDEVFADPVGFYDIFVAAARLS